MEKDTKLSKGDLDYIINQLKQPQKESASTIAVQPRLTHFNRFSAKHWLMGLIFGVILALAAIFTWQFYSQKAETLKNGSAVESVKKLSKLATAQGHIKTIISKEDNELFGKEISFNFPGSKRTLFLVVPADVTAGVDLEHLTKKDITIDDKTKTITMKLPHAAIIQEPSLDLKNIQTFSEEGIFRSDVSWDEGFELADLAKQRVEEEAINSGLLKTAETNARVTLQDFFKNLGYSVEVTFQ